MSSHGLFGAVSDTYHSGSDLRLSPRALECKGIIAGQAHAGLTPLPPTHTPCATGGVVAIGACGPEAVVRSIWLNESRLGLGVDAEPGGRERGAGRPGDRHARTCSW